MSNPDRLLYIISAKQTISLQENIFMFIKNGFTLNNSNLKLWRYLQRDKLFYLLESSNLYFCRADYFQKEDIFEGSYFKRYLYQLLAFE